MLARINSYGLSGIKGLDIKVEVYASSGLPKLEMVGLPDAATKEAAARVRSAIKNSGFIFPHKNYIVNLAPADIRKEGTMYDLPIALGVLAATGQLEGVNFSDYVIVGELSLYGEIRQVNGILPIIIAARGDGCKNIIVPHANRKEASFVDGINVYTFSNLKEIIKFFVDKTNVMPIEKQDILSCITAGKYSEDFKYVKGQYVAKRALEIAAAGSHNILLIGPPGGGKTMLAKCLPSILPDLTVSEVLETTKIHSIAGCLDDNIGLVTRRPFRTPHHTSSRIALTGGGSNAKPGEISLAHNGVLFLDEMPEYDRAALEILRQPLEDNVITISRAMRSVEYPANFMLVASMNPCPCGNRGSSITECQCTPVQVQKYRGRLSSPLLDRIDQHVEVNEVEYDQLSDKSESESSSEIKKRVNTARAAQLERFKGLGIYSNARMSNPMVNDYCKLDAKSEDLLRTAFSRLGLSARAYIRICKVSRTIADLEGSAEIKPPHVAEAIGYRTLDRNTF